MRRKRVYDNGIFYRVPYGLDNRAAAWYNYTGAEEMTEIGILETIKKELDREMKCGGSIEEWADDRAE